MNYNQRAQNTVTMIEELPDLQDVENSYNRQYNSPHEEDIQKYQRHIRNGHTPSQESGMMSPLPLPPPPPHQPHQHYRQLPQMESVNPALAGISCLDIASHVGDCPICSKFYKNDITAYIICIVVLAIICLLLLKKVLDV